MLTNYIVIALRNIKRQKLFTTINVLGLALGLASVFLVTLFVYDELRFDRFHAKGERIYRIVGGQTNNGEMMYKSPLMPARLAEHLTQNYTEVEAVSRFGETVGEFVTDKITLKPGPDVLGASVDSTFLTMFSFPVLAGTPDIGKSRTTLVLTRSLATTLFGGPFQAVGKMVKYYGVELPVSAVLEDVPKYSHIQFTFLIPYQAQKQDEYWEANAYHEYVLLRENANPRAFADTIRAIGKRFIAPALRQYNPAWGWEQEIEPLFGIRLHSSLTGTGDAKVGTYKRVMIFASVGALVLLLACINYVNLSTARSMLRAKEVGIRKTLGASRAQVMVQFLSESAGLVVVAFVLAAVMCELALPMFNSFSGKTFLPQDLMQWRFLAIVAAILLTTILVSGGYAAFVLSAFKPQIVLKLGSASSLGNARLRKGLVIAQFTIATALISGIVVMGEQLRFMQQESLGFAKNTTAAAYLDPAILSQQTAFKARVDAIPGIEASAMTYQCPALWTGAAKVNASSSNTHSLNTDSVSKPSTNSVNALLYAVTKDFRHALAIPLQAGRFFTTENDSSANVVVNEAFVRSMGWKDAVGETIRYEQNSQVRTMTIIGVVADFHSKSFRDAIEPIVFEPRTHGQVIILRFRQNQMQSALQQFTTLYNSYAPQIPLELRFLDAEFAKYYTGEETMRNTLNALTVIACCIAALGLFGLAAFAAERRTKEIGIRKVLGASVASIVGLLSRDFLRLVLAGIVIAVPVAYYGANVWLRDFAYKIRLEWWLFAASGIVAIVLAFLTVVLQSWRAARTNPVEALRSE
ncbi:MAG: ABC transporter permease [Candidatus Kapabacteria bacterium]|jgi:putative ABC transport system permease protein|nr:ABC transporter permease [Candidatus Kapabacteria bacterium]